MKTMKLTYPQLFSKLAVYCAGLMTMAFGITFSIRSDLGISPVSSLPYAMGRVTGINMGTFVTLFFILYILLQLLLLRKDFKWVDLSQILFSFLFGYFVDFSNGVLADFSIPTYGGQLLMLIISIFLISFGLTLYIKAKLVVLPPEGVVLAITRLLPQGKFSRVKMSFDCILVAIAILLTFTFLGSVEGVREGTILSAILIGRLVPFNTRLADGALGRLGYYRLNPSNIH